METVTDPIHPAAKALKNVCAKYIQDLEALPEEAFNHKFHPKSRTIADIVVEVNLANDLAGHALREEPIVPWPTGGWVTAPEDCRTKAAVIAAFRNSADRIVATADSFSAEEMDATVKNEEGEATRLDEIRFLALHAWYHLGQLNFVQTLYGDDAMHWR